MRILLKILLPALCLSGFANFTKAEDYPLGDINYVKSKVGNSDSFNGTPLRNILNSDGAPCHQGYRIFDSQVLSSSPDSLVLKFLERYLLLLDVLESDAVAARRMDDDHVVFVKGDRKSMMKLAESDIDISIEKKEWSQKKEISVFMGKPGNAPEVVVSFPPSYELLLGMTRRELEEEFPKSLGRASNLIPDSIPMTDIEPIDSLVWGSSSFQWFEHHDLNNRTYFNKDRGKVSPVFNDSLPAYSAANLFMGISGEDRTLNVNQQLYGFKESGVVTSVAQWINYCRDNGLITYFAVEKEFPDHILGFVSAVNPSLMYIHLLSIEIPLDLASNKKAMIKGKIRTFIPTHNLKTLYQENE